MASSGIIRPMDLVRTDVSEEFSASIISVTRISELGRTLANISNRLTLRRIIKISLTSGDRSIGIVRLRTKICGICFYSSIWRDVTIWTSVRRWGDIIKIVLIWGYIIGYRIQLTSYWAPDTELLLIWKRTLGSHETMNLDTNWAMRFSWRNQILRASYYRRPAQMFPKIA
jgi:hypothetical protein